MKTQIIFTILALIAYINANSATISISKKDSKDPTNVCNNSTYYYVTSISGAPNGYTVSWLKTNADISTQSTSEAGVKWTATSDANGYIGTIQAQLKNASGTVIAESNTITVTIKSILHMEPTLTPITNGTTYNISPCSQGQISLEVTKLEIPGTGTNPDKIYNYAWYLPPEWSANGQTSITGNDPIYGGSYITATYPASSTSGTIKVKGYEAIIGCDATVQSSKLATATINRDVTLSLSANKSYFLCGDTTPITYTVTASPALPCALYYWNNSSTATPSNTFQKVPALGNENVTVTVVYGNNSKTLSITVPVKTFNRLKPPIEGPDNVCGTQQVEYTIPQIRSGYTTVWEYDKLTPVLLDNDHAIFTANGNGYGSVGATVYSQCGGVEPLAEKLFGLDYLHHPQFFLSIFAEVHLLK